MWTEVVQRQTKVCQVCELEAFRENIYEDGNFSMDSFNPEDMKWKIALPHNLLALRLVESAPLDLCVALKQY